MLTYFESLSWTETIYLASAVVGGILFLLRLLLFFFAGGIGEDINTDFDLETDGDISHGGNGELSFRALSLQSISAFFMMFGLAGLTLLSGDIHLVWVVIGSAAVGIFTVWVVGLLFNFMLRLQTEGTIETKNAIGTVGTVYLTIPENGSGQVRVNIQGAMRIYDAATRDGQTIKTGENIRVVDIIGERTLVVTKIN